MNRVSKGGIFRTFGGWVKDKVAAVRLFVMSYPFLAAPPICVCEGGGFICTHCPKI